MQSQDCIDLNHALLEARLNAATLSATHSLYLDLSMPDIPLIQVLVDSSSSHSFIDTSFVTSHKIPTVQWVKQLCHHQGCYLQP
jgi:hypothetical protein